MFVNDSVHVLGKSMELKSKGKKRRKPKPKNAEINQIYTVKHSISITVFISFSVSGCSHNNKDPIVCYFVEENWNTSFARTAVSYVYRG